MITYVPVPGAGSLCYKVKLDGKPVGGIYYKSPGGYYYKPAGGGCGKTFSTVETVKASLERP